MVLVWSHDSSWCSYLRQILNETLRLSTLAPYAARFCDHDIVVGGYHIPAGTPVVHALGVLLKNESIWKCPHKLEYTHILLSYPRSSSSSSSGLTLLSVALEGCSRRT